MCEPKAERRPPAGQINATPERAARASKEPEIRNPLYAGATPGMIARALVKRKPVEKPSRKRSGAQTRI